MSRELGANDRQVTVENAQCLVVGEVAELHPEH